MVGLKPTMIILVFIAFALVPVSIAISGTENKENQIDEKNIWGLSCNIN